MAKAQHSMSWLHHCQIMASVKGFQVEVLLCLSTQRLVTISCKNSDTKIMWPKEAIGASTSFELLD